MGYEEITDNICQGRRFDVFILVALAFGRLSLLLMSPTGLSGDAHTYLKDAQHIISTGQLPSLRAQPNGFALLISPLFAVTGNSFLNAALYINVLMETAIVSIITLFFFHLFSVFGLKNIRLGGCILLLLQPFTATMVNSVHTEQVCQFFLFFGVFTLVLSIHSKKRRFLIVVGTFLLSAASIIRTELFALSLVTIIAFFFFRFQSQKDITKVWFRDIIFAALLFVAVPTFMLIFQYISTAEFGLIKPVFHNSGYMAWMRTWFAISPSQHNRFAFSPGKPAWKGFHVNAYPERAFDTIAERSEVQSLLNKWQKFGYITKVNQGFSELASYKSGKYPLRHYLFIPIARMIHYWVNVDGAQSFLRILPVKRPLSTFIVLLTVLLKAVLLLLFLIGTYALVKPGCLNELDSILLFPRLALIAVLFRTLELGVLGSFVWAGLMEIRYVVIVFPFFLIISEIGLFYIFYRKTMVFNSKGRAPIFFGDKHP